MTMVLWVLGVWLLVSLPVALFIGTVCSPNCFEDDQGWITNPPLAAQEAFNEIRSAA